jgi:hypothetical protein
MGAAEAYYWAGGRKVQLLPSPDVVIDLDADLAGVTAGLRDQGRQLVGHLVLVPRAAAEQALGDAAATAAGVHPVFRTEDGSLIVVLPQVRVEAQDPRRLEEVVRSLTRARVSERSEERLVLEPHSGRGEDALDLANHLAEHMSLDVSQARFVRVVPRPTRGPEE